MSVLSYAKKASPRDPRPRAPVRRRGWERTVTRVERRAVDVVFARRRDREGGERSLKA